MTVEKAAVLQSAASALLAGDNEGAAQILREQYPFEPQTRNREQVSQPVALQVFMRDGFVDRYTGKRLVFPAALRVMSRLLPEQFPYQSYWKFDICHFGYYELFAVVDHLHPRVRGGNRDPDNLVTTSPMRNSAKSNYTLAELGWQLLDGGDLNEWDGMLGWFLTMTERKPELLQVNDIRDWWRAARNIGAREALAGR